MLPLHVSPAAACWRISQGESHGRGESASCTRTFWIAVEAEAGARARQLSFVGGWAIAAVLAVLALLLYEIRIALLPFCLRSGSRFCNGSIYHIDPTAPREPALAGGDNALHPYSSDFGRNGVLDRHDGGGRFDASRASRPGILRRFIGQAIGSAGITFLGQTYTPDDLVQALGREVHRGSLGSALSSAPPDWPSPCCLAHF